VSEEQWRFAERYDLLGRLGVGAVGAVWLVRDRQTGLEYAIKILRPELTGTPEAVDGLRAVHAALAEAAHPNIVGATEIVAHESRVALVMRPVPGEDLRVLLARMGRLAPAHAALLVAQLCDALAAAHAAGVAHGGVKPSNVLLEPLQDEVGSLRVGLTDFGVAALAAGAGVTPLNDEIGASYYAALPAEYQAPEIEFGQIAAPHSDVYATGVLLYETLAGRPPFTGDPIEVLRRQREELPERIAGLPDPLWLLVASCLDKHPQHRPTAADLASLLREIAPAVEATPAWAVREGAKPQDATAPITIVAEPVTEPGLAFPAALAVFGAGTGVGAAAAVAAESEPHPPGRGRRALTAPRRVELLAIVGVVVLAFVVTLLFASAGSKPPETANIAAIPPATSMGGPGGVFVTATATLTTSPSASATTSVSASATATPGITPTPRRSPSAPVSLPSASPSPVAPPTSAKPTQPAPPPSTNPPPVRIWWQCSNNNTSGGISKRSCIGVGSDGWLYIQASFTAPPGQFISDIRLTLETPRWTYTTVSKSCSGWTCSITAGPYNPPTGYYWNVSGIDNSSHNETSPAEFYQQR
jgi:serine/threonine protein kinase, bacterial